MKLMERIKKDKSSALFILSYIMMISAVILFFITKSKSILFTIMIAGMVLCNISMLLKAPKDNK